MIVVPQDQLQPQTLNRLIEEFVTRHGAVHGHADVSSSEMSAMVLRQLRSGEAMIVFDEASESCSIIAKSEILPSKAKEDSDPLIED